MATKEQDATFGYQAVEKALARVFGVDEAARQGAFRARLQNLKRLGLSAATPGRGKQIAYTREDADLWLWALELSHFRFDPSLVASLVMQDRALLRRLAADARTSDVFIAIDLEGLSETPVIGHGSRRGLLALGNWLADTHEGPRRRSIFSLSARVQALDDALAEEAT